ITKDRHHAIGRLVITKAPPSSNSSNTDATIASSTTPATVDGSRNPRVQGERSEALKA
ncbi:unnamed protein product, partial [Dovyalis caffra]